MLNIGLFIFSDLFSLKEKKLQTSIPLVFKQILQNQKFISFLNIFRQLSRSFAIDIFCINNNGRSIFRDLNNIRRYYFSLPTFVASFLLFSIISGIKPIFAKSHKFYAGIDLQYNAFSFDNSNPSLSDGSVAYEMTKELFPHEIISPNFFIGFNNQKNLMLELNYGSGKDVKSNNSTGLGFNGKGEIGKYGVRYPYKYNTNNKLELSYFNFDVKPYTMLDDVTALYAIFGVGRYNVAIQEQGFYDDGSNEYQFINTSTVSKFVPSIGLGLEFRLFESIFARAQFRYTALKTTLPGSQIIGTININNLISASVGAGYSF